MDTYVIAHIPWTSVMTNYGFLVDAEAYPVVVAQHYSNRRYRSQSPIKQPKTFYPNENLDGGHISTPTR